MLTISEILHKLQDLHECCESNILILSAIHNHIIHEGLKDHNDESIEGQKDHNSNKNEGQKEHNDEKNEWLKVHINDQKNDASEVKPILGVKNATKEDNTRF